MNFYRFVWEYLILVAVALLIYSLNYTSDYQEFFLFALLAFPIHLTIFLIRNRTIKQKK